MAPAKSGDKSYLFELYDLLKGFSGKPSTDVSEPIPIRAMLNAPLWSLLIVVDLVATRLGQLGFTQTIAPFNVTNLAPRRTICLIVLLKQELHVSVEVY
jgi:hypothetical protein